MHTYVQYRTMEIFFKDDEVDISTQKISELAQCTQSWYKKRKATFKNVGLDPCNDIPGIDDVIII